MRHHAIVERSRGWASPGLGPWRRAPGSFEWQSRRTAARSAEQGGNPGARAVRGGRWGLRAARSKLDPRVEGVGGASQPADAIVVPALKARENSLSCSTFRRGRTARSCILHRSRRRDRASCPHRRAWRRPAVEEPLATIRHRPKSASRKKGSRPSPRALISNSAEERT